MFDRLATELISNNKPIEFNQHSDELGKHLCEIFTLELLQAFPLLKAEDKKHVSVYYKKTKNIVTVETQRTAIKVTLNAKYGTLDDENRLLRNVSNIGHWGSGDYQIKLENPDNFKIVFDFINQIY
jgi:predicted transport protein